MKKSKTTITVWFKHEPDISEEDLETIISETLCHVSLRIAKGETEGDVSHTSSELNGKFTISTDPEKPFDTQSEFKRHYG